MTKAQRSTLEQIHRAGFAFYGKFGWTVNGWVGKGPTQYGPSKPMMQLLIDMGWLRQAESRNRYNREFQLTIFGLAAIGAGGERLELANGVVGERFK